jgi:GNAT superfamily N-acetyltransferase
VRVAQVGAGSSAFPVVYEELLRPAFPPAELESPDYLRDALLAGRCVISTLVDDEDRPLGAAVGEWDPASRVLLLAYLAVRRACRSQGVGGLLMDEVGGPWQERFRPDLTLAEVEHPLAHAAHEDFGDPAARLAFYHRHGARALDVPYFQPPLTPGGGRVYGLLLVAVRPFPARAASGRTTRTGPPRGCGVPWTGPAAYRCCPWTIRPRCRCPYRPPGRWSDEPRLLRPESRVIIPAHPALPPGSTRMHPLRGAEGRPG